MQIDSNSTHLNELRRLYRFVEEDDIKSIRLNTGEVFSSHDRSICTCKPGWLVGSKFDPSGFLKEITESKLIYF